MRINQPPAGGGPSRAVDVAGRTDVKDRVYRTVAQVTSANVIGVSREDVRVEVAEDRSGLALRVESPLPVPDLNDSAAIAATEPVLDRARQLQEDLQQRLAGILGRDITRINITITGAVIPQRRRVR